ncbi:Xaa-Pro peptidase family protein [Pelotomaculum isophthalicicum JI]|uniref:Xaa-Pro peptidase family protein n=1 Tax=Pelotomaculum isophthalicicum JI TaxID=947010 RepID=A0A9X4JVT6_9FIRM|nr:Xaa-Pro peptidase family protein [Pelotomaculum isophthalicicum]MDF9408936.1 Xaa-Pro peptidase family protein [Pelotomaculum isophthalicicum JI]
MQVRINKLQELLAAAQIEALYVTNPENRYYLSGFTGTDGALLVCRDKTFLLTDFRYLEQAKDESPGMTIIEVKDSYAEALASILAENKISSLGCEGEHLAYNQFLMLKDKLVNLEIKEKSGLVEKLRLTKYDDEIKNIAEAVRLAEQAFEKVLPIIKPGVSEREVALQLEYSMRCMGADGAAFDIIVASGPRSALPHGVASTRKLREGDLVTLDFGAVYHGYHSDITRTVVIGEPGPKQQEIYYIVLEAQMRAIEAIRSGRRASDVDRIARDVIAAKGYGERFGHGTGHGLGLSIHENPRLSSKDDTVLRQGMIVTVEPGIYLPDWGGVRIEDTVVVEESGCKVLTGIPKDKLINLLNLS